MTKYINITNMSILSLCIIVFIYFYKFNGSEVHYSDIYSITVTPDVKNRVYKVTVYLGYKEEYALNAQGYMSESDGIKNLQLLDIDDDGMNEIIVILQGRADNSNSTQRYDIFEITNQKVIFKKNIKGYLDLSSKVAVAHSNRYFFFLLGLVPFLIYGLLLLKNHRHPLILSLERKPKRLLILPIDQLSEAQHLLVQTGYLDKLLSDIGVSKKTLQAAISFMNFPATERVKIMAARSHSSSWEQAFKCFSVNLRLTKENEGAVSDDDSKYVSMKELYVMTLSKKFPLNINRLQLFLPENTAAEDAVNQLKNIPQAQNDITLIIGNSSDYQRKLHTKTSDTSNKWVAPLGYELTNFLLSQDAESALAEILAGQLSLQQISPYRIGGGVANESLFFGRREMISQIINRDPANYLIVGGRQVGKSTLLKALERRYADNGQVECFYLSLSNEVLVPRLSALLKLEKTRDPEVLAAALEEKIRESGQRYVFLVDEADTFIKHEQQQHYPILQVFRRLSEQGACTFILGGFWQLYQHAVLDYQSPIRNFGELIQVGALEHEACLQLATVPMQSMQLDYANPTLVETLINACGQRANLITKTCQTIVTHLPTKQRIIEAGDVHKALHSDVIRKELTGWAVGNNKIEQHYDRLVVYATIEMDDFSTGELIQLLQDKQVKLDIAELERTLSRLEMAFVVGRDNGRWSYRVPLFVEYMKEESPALKFAAELQQGF